MNANFSAALALVLPQEGGFQDNPHDRGNWTSGIVGQGTLKGTKYGISAAAYPLRDIENLTLADAATIYQWNYWAPAGCDLLPTGVDLCVFDATVNEGQRRAVEALQGVVGCGQDGVCGPVTCAAVAKLGSAETIALFSDARRVFYRQAATNPNEAANLGDWMRRVQDIETAALGWIAKGQ